MKFAVQPYAEDKALVDALLPLINAHGLERLGAERFVPKFDRVIPLWKSGVFRLVLAKDPITGAIVGYQLWMFNELIFEPGIRAMLGPVFLKKEYRGNLKETKEFIRFGVNAMRALGATDIRAECDADQPTAAMYRRAGAAEVMSTQVRFTI